MTDDSRLEADLRLIVEALSSAFADKVNDPRTDALARATGLPAPAVFFAANVRGLVEKPERLEALARIAGIPPERVPDIRSALMRADRESLSS